VLGQWVKAPAGSKNKVELVIVNNDTAKNIPTGGSLKAI
jgi:branched-chain amino acid transport system substrate-binding protein